MSTTSLVYNNYLGTWQYFINLRGSTTSGALKIVANIAARNATTNRDNMAYWVLDATGDPSVKSGSALYTFNSETQQWLKLAEQESMDISISFAWNQIENGPSSSISQIDDAVSVAHSHTNKNILDTITIDDVHAHSNKTLLDSITTESGYLHTHLNLAALNTFTATEISRLRSITQEQVDGLHVHSNLIALNRFGVNANNMITIDGTDLNTLLRVVSITENGIMTASDKIKLDSLTGDPVFPENPNPGDLMVGTSAADMGNNANTAFLLQPESSNGELVDIAVGTAAPATLVNNGTTINEDKRIVFGPTTSINIAANTLPLDVLVPDHAWCIDVAVKITDGGTNTAHPFFGTTNNHAVFFGFHQTNSQLYFTSDAGATYTDYLVGTDVIMTLEYFYDEAAGYYREARYIDGALQIVTGNATLNPESTRAAIWSIGKASAYSESCSGIVRSVRIRNIAPYRGQSFTPQALPWVSPGPNYWAKTSLADVKTLMDQLSGAERRITINTGSFTGTRHLLLEVSSHVDYSVVETLINTETESADREVVFSNAAGTWATCPSAGFTTAYQNSAVYVILDNSIDLNTLKYVRYKWFKSASVLSYTLSSAGSTDVNDIFYPAEAADVTNYYGTTLDNIWMSSDKTCQMFKDTSSYYGMGENYWVIVSVADGMPYYSGSGATPDVVTWYTYAGTDPVPSVTSTTSAAVDDGWNYTAVGSLLLQPINKGTARYSVASFSGAVIIDYLNGEHQVCATTDNVTGITINNLPINTGMVLDINNAAGKTVTFGTTELLAASDTGRYPIAFYNDNGTIFAILNGAFVS